MRSIRTWLPALLAASSLFAGVAAAQTYDHSVYLDIDNNAATGCNVVTAAGAVNGAELRITATVTGTPPMVTASTRANCVGGVFGPGQPQSATYAVGLNNGIGGADVIEIGTPLAGLPGGPARATFVSSTAGGADQASGIVQLPGGGQLSPITPILVPATGIVTLLLLVGLVFFVARRHPGVATSAAVLLMLGAGIAWAANFVVDGQVGDWAGVQPLAMDAANDATSGDTRIEIVAVFAATEAGNLYLRLDVLDAQVPTNIAPVLNDINFSVPENSAAATAVGTAAATDANAGQVLTYAITAGNAAGAFAINPSTGAITVANATPLNFEATPSFTLTVTVTDNGQPVMSDTASVTVALTNVNEAPVLADGVRAVAEDSPAATQVGAPLGGTDPDAGSSLAYAITAGNTNGAFAIDNAGQLTVANAAAISSTGTFTLVVTLTDGALSDTATITVNVTDQNDAPQFTGEPYAFTSAENRTAGAAIGSVTATDADAGQVLAYAITAGNTGGAFAINNSGQITVANVAAVDFEATPAFTLSITVTDNGATPLSDTTTATITITDVNEAPVATDAAFAVAENSAIGTSVGTVAATDPDIDPPAPNSPNATLSFAITAGNTGNVFAINAATGVITTTAAPVLANSPYSLTVTVSDGGAPALADTATVVITVTDQNDAPVLNDAAFSVAENSAAGSAVGTVAATDPDAGQVIAYAITAGNAAGGFAINANTGAITVANAAALDFETTPAFTLTVSATDNGAPPLGDTAQVTITLTNANDAPVANDAAMTVAENSANGTVVGTYAGATDPDAGQVLSYAITGGTGAGFFAINAGSGQVTVSNGAGLDFEATPMLTLVVTATDNGAGNLADTGTITVTLTNVNEAPVANDIAFSVAENSPNGTAVGTVVANDADAGTTLAYAITAGNTNGAFAINAATGAITVANQAEIDFGASFALTVTVSDGVLSDTAAVAISVNDVNEPPAPTASPSATPTISESTAVGTTVATILANDPEAAQSHAFVILSGNTGSVFALDPATGVLTVAAPLDFEGSDDPYALVIRVTDNGAPALSADIGVTVTLSDANEAPAFTSANAASIAENTTAVLTVTTTDPEAGAITYAIAGGVDSALFTIDASTGALAFLAAPNFEAPADSGANNVYNVIVSAADGSNTPTQAIAVTVTNANEGPAFTSPAAASVAENTLAALTVVATDPDGPSITYSITGGADAARFSIDGSSGALVFLASPDFEAPTDAGADNVYNVVVTATDGTFSPTQAIAITVTNANEAPAFTSAAAFTVDENQATAGTVATTDPEGNAVTYTVTGGADQARFAIDANTGLLTFLVAPNFEAPVDAGANNVYDVQVTASDGTNATQQSIAVTVANVDEPPSFSSPNTASVAENTTAVLTVVAGDPEGGAVTYSILPGGDGALFAIDAGTGALAFIGAPNFEAPGDGGGNNVYDLTVQAIAGTAITQNIAVTVTNANEAPVLDDQARAIDENSPNGTNVGAVLAFSEPDAGQTQAFAITAGNTGGAFAIGNTGQITVANVAALNFESTPSFTLTVTLTDNGAPVLGDTATVTVTVNNLNEAPTAAPDAMDYRANTELRADGHPGDVAGTLVFITTTVNPRANDSDPDSVASGFGTIAIVAADGTSANGGDFRIETDGKLRYTPPAGFTGTDTLTYQLSDGTNLVNGTITFTRIGTDVAWYVKNNDATSDAAGATPHGTSSFPFNTLAAAQAASLANQIVYVHSGDGLTTGQNSGFVLKSGQQLLGQGVDLVVDGITFIAAGAQPQIGNSAGVGVTALNVSATQVRGLDIGASSDAILASTSGASSGGIEVANNTIRAAGADGIDIETAGTGSFVASVHDNVVTATNVGIDIAEGAGTTLTLTAFDDNTVSGNTGGTGIVVTNATFDGTVGGAFNAVSGGATVVGASGNPVGASGIVITTSAGDLAFTTLTVFAGNGNGLAATGTAPFNAATGTGLRLTATSASNVFQATAGPAINIGTATIDIANGTVTSANSTTNGVNLDTVTGTFSAGSSSSITGTTAAATAYRINASNVTATWNGTITATQGAGVALTNNTGSTMAFTGQVALSTGGAAAFAATGGGTVSATHAGSTLATTTATALNVSNTNIGAADLTFRSISANGAVNGILLSNTGTAGGLKVLGLGTATVGGDNSGGTIQATSSHGVSLANTREVAFTNLRLLNTGGHGIDGTGVVDFSFANGTIQGAGDGASENSINFDFSTTAANVSGVVSITNSVISQTEAEGIKILNHAGTISNLAITGNTLGDTGDVATPGSAVVVLVNAVGVGNAAQLTRATLSNNTISDFRAGAGFVIQGNSDATGAALVRLGTPGSGTDIVSVTNNLMNGGNAGVGNQPDRFITTAINGTGVARIDISNNGTAALPIRNIDGVVIEASLFGAGDNVGGTVDMDLTINNNFIAANNAVASAGLGIGCDADSFAATNDAGTMQSVITGNNVSLTDGPGIYTLARGSTCTHNVRLTSNTVAAPNTTTAARAGIRVDSGSAVGDTTLCVQLGDGVQKNVTAGSTNTGTATTSPGINLRKQGTVQGTNEFGIEGLAPSPTGTPNVENFVNSQNTSTSGTFGVGGTAMLSGTSGFQSCATAP